MEMLLICLGLGSSALSTVLGVICEGAMYLTYFTTQSNILVSLVTFLLLMNIIRKKDNNGSGVPPSLYFITVVAITVTFLVFMIVLAPTSGIGFIGAYMHNYGSSFLAHFVAPICIVLHYFLYNREVITRKQIIPMSVLFPLAYLIFVYLLGKAGFVWGEYKMSMPYNFLNYKAPCGWFGIRLDTIGPTSLGIGVAYMVIFLAIFFVLLGWMMRSLKERSIRRSEV